eukprot:scaffold17175_cov65-Cyclotella_meneghiniana.AAC.6
MSHHKYNERFKKVEIGIQALKWSRQCVYHGWGNSQHLNPSNTSLRNLVISISKTIINPTLRNTEHSTEDIWMMSTMVIRSRAVQTKGEEVDY